jgi:Ser/Thr protein kinase RdoA (MazF antagonist)
MHWDELAPQARSVLLRWIDDEPVSISPVFGGTLNWNFRVVAASGASLLRCHRDNLESERIEGEHGPLAWVAARAIPAPVPIPAPTGQTLVEAGGHRWSFAPWLPGELLPRGTLSPARARSLGAITARFVHAACG